MGFVTGSSCCLHSPLFSTSSSQCYLYSPFSFPSRRNPITQRKKRGTMACLQQDNPKNIDFSKRRMILFMGLTVIPLLNIRANALEAENMELRKENQKQNEEQSTKWTSPQNPLFALLNTVGFLGSGVLAALYALVSKDKASSDATIESLNIKLKEKETAITFMEKKFEIDLLNEKEFRNKALIKANAAQQSLVNKLNLANGTIKSLEQELQKEKQIVEELTFQVDSLKVNLRKAGDEKTKLQEQLKEKLDCIVVLEERVNLLSSEIKDKEENIWNLNSEISEKERELGQLRTLYQLAQDQITGLNSNIEKLKDVILKNKKELELKNETVHDLDVKLNSLLSQRNEISKKLDETINEYSLFKLSAEKKAALDSELLVGRTEQIEQIEVQLKSALNEVNEKTNPIADLNREKDDLREMLNIELKNVKNFENELKLVEENLVKSRSGASDLGKQLQESKQLCSKLEAAVSNVRAEYNEARDSLQRRVDEEKAGAEILAGELKSANDLLTKSENEMRIIAKELADTVKKSDILEKELIDVRKREETVSHELKEEKNIISSLKNELNVLETQIMKNSERKKNLEEDLEEATKSLDEMNRNALLLSSELELANSQISSLENEKDAAYRLLDDEKRVSQEARENLENAHSLVMRLGKERENLENRGKKLKDEMASAKGEILRLRYEMNSKKGSVNAQDVKKVEGGEKAVVPVRKVTRRKKVTTPKQEDL